MEPAGEMVRTHGFLAFTICCIFCCLMTMGCDGYGEGQQPASWLPLTRDNFTSKLKEHEFSLCVAALPWCGESKSLMKDILNVLKEDPDSFGGLQLFVVHINKDRLFGKAILDGSIPPSFTLFRYGTPYKYNGRRSTSSIMASIREGISVLRSASVLVRIESPQDLEIFADSTDKAVVLFDFCGWEMKVQQKQRRTSTTDDIESVHSDSQIPRSGEKKKDEVPESSNLEGVQTFSSKARDSSYRMQTGEKQVKTKSFVQSITHNDRLPTSDISLGKPFKESVQTSDSEIRVGDELDDIADCMNQNALYCISGNAFQNLDHAKLTDTNLGDNSETAGAQDVKREKEVHQDQLLCTSEEYEIFKVLYDNVTKLAADNILTPQRTHFAISTSGEIASQVGISTQGRPWILMYLLHDFDRLPYSFNGLGNVEDFLFDHSPPLVFELEGEGHNSASSALLNDTPSVILFIDRMSNSPDVRVKSKAALDALRALSYDYASLANDGVENGRQRRKSTWKQKRISEAKEKVEYFHIEEQTTGQTVEPTALLSLLEKPDLHTGRVLKADVQVVLQLLTDQYQSRNEIAGKDVLLGNGDILSKLSQLKFLEEKVRQSVAFGADSWLLPIQVSDDQLQSANQPEETLGHYCNEGHSNDGKLSKEQSFRAATNDGNLPGESSCLDCLFTEDKLRGESLSDDISDATTDESVQHLTCLPTQMTLEYNNGLGSSANKDIFSDGEDHHKSLTETACVGEEEGTSSCAVEVSDSRSLLLSALGENGRSAVAIDEGKSSIVRREDAIKLTNEEDLQQFVVDEDNESNTYLNELGVYFIDGEDSMKEKLATDKEIPALVIIDPERQAHYRFPSNVVLNVTTLSNFVDSFLSGVLKRTVFSEPDCIPPRQPPRPPFVNQDFHEMFPVPRVTADSFLKLVTGVSEPDEERNEFTLHQSGREESEENGGNLTESAWDRDVLVLFTTPWCGFCKRMELVVREVYRSFQLVRSHEDLSNGGINNSDDYQNLNDVIASRPARCAGGHCTVKKSVRTRRRDAAVREPPLLLQMDCTMNDCSDYLGELFEEETYPAVVLFPARNKFSPVIYSGAPTVQGIHDFLKVHGTATSSTQKHEGNSLIQNRVIREGKVCTSRDDVVCDTVVSSTSIKIGSGPGRGSKLEAATLLWELNSRQIDFGRHAEVGSVLLASEKLLDASPVFENSIILIISSTQHGMVHGLIANKPMAWKNVVGLDGKMEELLNPAALGYGGPVVENHRPFLVVTHLHGLEEFTEIIPGIYFAFVPSKGRILDMIHIGKFAAKDFWFFLGYSSWTWRQLQSELIGELWQVRPFSNDLVKWPIQWTT